VAFASAIAWLAAASVARMATYFSYAASCSWVRGGIQLAASNNKGNKTRIRELIGPTFLQW
jgi:hypothetical protein